MLGSGTVLADDPRLDVRLVPCPGPQPRAVVLDARLRTPPGANLARPGTVILTGPAHDRGAARALRQEGVEVHEVGATPDGHLDLAEALGRLTELGVTSVLAEPGVTLANALVSAGLVDRLVAHVALGIGEGPLCLPVGEPPGSAWETERVGGAGDDLLLHLVPTPTAPGPQPSRSEES